MTRIASTRTQRCLSLACFVGAFMALVLYAPRAGAYEQYSQNKDATNCRGCHGDFRASPYVSLVDGSSWGDDAHDVHRNIMLDGDCATCHGSGPRFPVLIGSSAGGSGFPAIGCVGCHGRAADTGNDGISPGYGAGLRQHHTNAGVADCAGCHSDADPADYTPVGEDVPPDYYFTPDPAHADKPTDSCSPNGEEDYAGSMLGLDNDGNLLSDGDDPACAAPECGNGIIEAGEDCDDGNTLDGDCCSATCQFEAADSPCPDGMYCNGDETCDGAGTCQAGTPVDCSDGVGCTVDSCDEATDSCDNTPDDDLCDNGVFCDGTDVCDSVNDCQPGTAVDCDDGVDCTDDSCDEVNDVCVNDPNDLNCTDDGLFCTGDAFCDAVMDCSAAGDPCDAGTVCNEETDTCDTGGSGGGCELRPPGSGRSGMSNATSPILILLCLCALLIRKRRRNRRPATGR
jgi:hypothetical protein